MKSGEWRAQDVAGELEELRREYDRRAEHLSMDELDGAPVDKNMSVDYEQFNDADLENELWSRLPEMDKIFDRRPVGPVPNSFYGWAKRKIKSLLFFFAMPVMRVCLARMSEQNRHVQFIQLLLIKQLRRRLQLVENENRELKGQLAALEKERTESKDSNRG